MEFETSNQSSLLDCGRSSITTRQNQRSLGKKPIMLNVGTSYACWSRYHRDLSSSTSSLSLLTRPGDFHDRNKHERSLTLSSPKSVTSLRWPEFTTMSIRPFLIDVSDAEIERLQRKLQDTRIPQMPIVPNAGEDYGQPRADTKDYN